MYESNKIKLNIAKAKLVRNYLHYYFKGYHLPHGPERDMYKTLVNSDFELITELSFFFDPQDPVAFHVRQVAAVLMSNYDEKY